MIEEQEFYKKIDPELTILELTDTAGRPAHIAVRDNHAPGRVFLFVHGLTVWSNAWRPLAGRLAPARTVCVDLKGFGHSGSRDRDGLSRFDHAHLLRQVIEHLDLRDFVLVTHSIGIAYAAPLFHFPFLENRIRLLMLLSPCGLSEHVPVFVSSLAENPLPRFAGLEALASLLLTPGFYDTGKITPEMASCCVQSLTPPGAVDSLVANAKHLTLLNRDLLRAELKMFRKDVFILRGANDAMADFYDSREFLRLFPGATVLTLPDCGHNVQLENPAAAAAFFRTHFGLPPLPEATEKETPETPEVPVRRRTRFHFHMSRLFDRRWPDTLLALCFIKFLQLLKRLGVRAKESGWRMAAGIFLRHEYSKFILGVFRLRYTKREPPYSGEAARECLIENLAAFLRGKRNLHWKILPGFFRMRRRRIAETDLVEARYSENGVLEEINPHFDAGARGFLALPAEDALFVRETFVRLHNTLWKLPDPVRKDRLFCKLRSAILRRVARGRSSWPAAPEMLRYVKRLSAATFIQFEILPQKSAPDFLKRRLASPDVRKYRHPGFGLLNIVARLTADLSEADLWMQFHHVPVDGLPMQELLQRLKEEWGTAGEFLYPAPGTDAAKPEFFYSGNRLFRARGFLDFSALLEARKLLNARYRNRMRGSATVASLILWGIARHPAFAGRKILFPVDITPEDGAEHELSLVFIRPSDYADGSDPLGGFLRFEHEFNYRLARTRAGRSESYEIMELYAMIHPVFYHIAQRLMPKALNDLVGTMGVTVLRNAEMFIAPMSDLQTDGFMAVSKIDMKREDGGTAGAVTVCGTKKQVRAYLEALGAFHEIFLELRRLGESRSVRREGEKFG